jgi:predicted dehydrogenase
MLLEYSSKAQDIYPLLNYGMVGGGQGAFIGDVHRKAAAFDRKTRLTAGCFSRNYDNSLETGAELGLSPERVYRTYEEMAEKESQHPDGIDFVVVVTPNNSHYHICKTFLNRGIHVVCDKPLTIEVSEAEELEQLALEKNLLFCTTYANVGYPMVKHARELVQRGKLGEIRMVMAEYPQEWLTEIVEQQGLKVAWRTDPAQQGKSTSVGDIGTHIENTVSSITGLKIKSICAKLDVFGEGRKLDTNASILLQYQNGASGMYWCSQIAVGHDNGLRIRVYGSKGSLEWEQENPNYLKVSYLDQPKQIISRGRDFLYPLAAQTSRIPGGHPEGTYEAFANLYRSFSGALIKLKHNQPLQPEDLDFPNVHDGVQGVKFVEKSVESSEKGSVWVDF